jgi:hypothetical protein
VPICRIGAPPGIGIAAKKKMVEKITAVIDEAYHIGDTLVLLRESSPENVALGWAAAVGKPQDPRDLAKDRFLMIAAFRLSIRAFWVMSILWVFNVWRAVALSCAFYQGQIGIGIGPDSLGAAFFISAAVVPPLLVTHGQIFWLLLRPQ